MIFNFQFQNSKSMIEFLDNFLNVIVDNYGKKNKSFDYKDLVELAFKFTSNDNKLNKRGRPKKNDTTKKNYWELIMHLYIFDEPTKYFKILKENETLQYHYGVIGLTNYIDRINFKCDSDEIIIRKIKELKKQNYEIMYKNERIKL